jgi:hypothetical protein
MRIIGYVLSILMGAVIGLIGGKIIQQKSLEGAILNEDVNLYMMDETIAALSTGTILKRNVHTGEYRLSFYLDNSETGPYRLDDTYYYDKPIKAKEIQE